MNQKHWIDKYYPKSLDSVIGNKDQINELREWVINFGDTKSSTIIISGNQGLGKTIIVKMILDSFDYITQIIIPSDIKEHRLYNDSNDYYIFNKSIFSKVLDNKKKKISLVFDDTENITLPNEKKYILELYKKNNKIKSFPLIFICNKNHSKLLYNLKKECKEIIFNYPSDEELSNFILDIYNYENIMLEKENKNEIIKKIIDYSQHDIRKLINILQELTYHTSDNNTLKLNNINNYFLYTSKKNIDIGLFESTHFILNKYNNFNIVNKLYQTEKVLLPLMIHENYIKKVLKNQTNTVKQSIDYLYKISESISQSDNIETSIYTDQNWYLQTMHGFYSCVNTSYWINKSNPTQSIFSDIRFSTDLNKTSLKNINRKNINNLSKIISSKNLDDILILNKICNYVENNKNNKYDLYTLFKNYDINIKDIILCLKIDKTI